MPVTDNSKSRSGSSTRSQRKKGQSQTGTSQNDDFWTCGLCKKQFGDPEDKLIECDRCKLFFCTKCLKMSDQTYAALCQAASVSHWFCLSCEQPALHAIRDDREIEEKCKAYFEEMNKRVEVLENEMPKKADKAVVDQLCSDINNLKTEMQGAHSDVSTLSDRLELIRKENEEKEKRKNNIVVHGLPEKENIPDEEIADELLSVIQVRARPRHVERLGQNRFDNPEVKGRPLRMVMENDTAKSEVMKNATKVRRGQTTSFDCKTVFINPDYTKLEREDSKKLREQLKKKRETDPNWIIRNFKIVRKPLPRTTGSPLGSRSDLGSPPRRPIVPPQHIGSPLSPSYPPASQLLAMRNREEEEQD